MPHEHAEMIQQVVSDVLEQLAFVFADPAEAEELPAEPGDLIAVSLDIHGAAVGRLMVVSGRAVCVELAGNLMGQDPDEVDPEQAGYALMEFSNVLCGQLLTEIAGVEPVFDLDPPMQISEPAAAWRQLCADDHAIAFLADDCPILVQLQLETPIAQAA